MRSKKGPRKKAYNADPTCSVDHIRSQAELYPSKFERFNVWKAYTNRGYIRIVVPKAIHAFVYAITPTAFLNSPIVSPSGEAHAAQGTARTHENIHIRTISWFKTGII